MAKPIFLHRTRHPHFADILTFNKVVDGGKIFANGILDVFEGFGFGLALGPTARQTGT